MRWGDVATAGRGDVAREEGGQAGSGMPAPTKTRSVGRKRPALATPGTRGLEKLERRGRPRGRWKWKSEKGLSGPHWDLGLPPASTLALRSRADFTTSAPHALACSDQQEQSPGQERFL